MYHFNDCLTIHSTSGERPDLHEDTKAPERDVVLVTEPRDPTGAERQVIYRADEILAFKRQYPMRRWVFGDGERSVWRDDGSIDPLMKAWLDRNCPGWGLLFSPDAVFGFTQKSHITMFKAAVSVLEVRREYLGRHDDWAAQERFMRSCDLDQFRWKFPYSRRLLADHTWPIWSSGMPRLRGAVCRWLNRVCPGWSHMSGTYYIGFANPKDAEAFEKWWRR